MKMCKKLISVVTIGATIVASLFTINVFADEFGYGDVNKDGKVSIVDAVLTQKMILKSKSLDSEQMRLADVDGNGSVTVTDIIIIQRYIAGIINEFPVNSGSNIATEPMTEEPTEFFTELSEEPTEAPTEFFTELPEEPTEAPTEFFTELPEEPTERPTERPTEKSTLTFDSEGYLNIVYKP